MPASLYTQVVLDHQRAPRNFGSLDRPTHAADGANPLCGDSLRIELRVEHDHIAQIRFHGECCAITMATASMLSEVSPGKSADDIVAMQSIFAQLVEGRFEADVALGKLNAMAALARYPARRKCALLPFATLRAALAGTKKITTEGSPMNLDIDASPLTFRLGVNADVPAIVALVESAYRGDASRKGWTTEADMLDGQRIDPAGVSEIIAKADSRVVLGERDGDMLACCHIEKLGDACYFGMFSVRPTLQGGGVGKLMMGQAERIARDEWHCREMQMTVISIRDELVAWYERRGYHRSGIFKPFPYGDERFGIPKRADLRFELLIKTL